MYRFRYENWYNLTEMAYRPHQLFYAMFHIVLLLFMIGESNVWIIMALVNFMFAYWHPVFLEDLASWFHSSIVGFFILVLLIFALVWEHHVGEKAVVALLIVIYVCLFAPLLHAMVVLKTPQRVSDYEERKARVHVDV
jgi:hypothetical protein